MNKILVIGTLIMILSFAGSVYGANDITTTSGNSGNESGAVLMDSSLKGNTQVAGQGLQDMSVVNLKKIDNENQNQVQNQNQINNSGEDSQIRNNEKEQSKDQNNGSLISVERRSEVANAVQEILKLAPRDGGIGEQIREIAQNQTQNQEKLEKRIENIENRSGFAKFFIGPKYQEINDTENLLKQNREQIQNLNQLKNQLTNKIDQEKLVEQMEILEKTNLEIENFLKDSEKGFSVLGWMFKLFSK